MGIYSQEELDDQALSDGIIELEAEIERLENAKDQLGDIINNARKFILDRQREIRDDYRGKKDAKISPDYLIQHLDAIHEILINKGGD